VQAIRRQYGGRASREQSCSCLRLSSPFEG
jgi:hypothetical protein